MQHDTYKVYEWTPRLKVAAHELMTKIRAVAPELEVLFMGAAALGLPGKNDIDLDILCDQQDIRAYAEILNPILGSPQQVSERMAVWNYLHDGIEIDCILSDPNTPDSHVPRQKKVFEKLKADPGLQARYKQLKYDCDGLPYAQYEAKKKAFFQEVENL
jgi:GrpB-like predicted nucleotidyltransferase (UPF0157 family)